MPGESLEDRGLVGLFTQVPADLKRCIIEAADAEGLRLNAFIAKALAKYVGRPELGHIPEGKKPGRRPKMPEVS